MTRDEAADELTALMASQYFAESYKDVVAGLANPELCGVNRHIYQKISSWYDDLKPDERGNIKYLIQEGILASLHSFLVLLDGGTGSPIIQGKLLSLGLVMNLYADEDRLDEGVPEESIQVAPTESGADLHDMFMYHVDELRPALV
jgi:hypothetical protein